MDGRSSGDGADGHGLSLDPGRESALDGADVAQLAREVEVGVGVTGLAGAQFIEEVDEVHQVGPRPHGVAQQRQAFVGAFLDARGSDTPVDGIMGLHHERPCVVVPAVGPQRQSEVGHVLEDPAEMVRLLLREAGQAQRDRRAVSVVLQEVERGGRGLLLAVRVVRQQALDVVERSVGPSGRGRHEGEAHERTIGATGGARP